MKQIMAKIFVRVGLFCIILLTVSSAQTMPVPINVHFPMLIKVLLFERALITKAGDEIIIGILYYKRNKSSNDSQKEILNLIHASKLKIGNSTIRCIPIEMNESTDLVTQLTRFHIHVLYITPIRAIDIEVISQTCQSKHIISMTGVTDYLESGIALGVGTRGEKPQIIVNLSEAKAEGADFSSKLLNLAKIIE